MRFSIKIFICTVLIVAAAFAAGGYLLISSGFDAARAREVSRAREEHLSLRFMLESGIIGEELKGNPISDGMLERVAREIAAGMEQDAQQGASAGRRSFIVSGPLGVPVFSNAPGGAEQRLNLTDLRSGQVRYSIRRDGDAYGVYISGLFEFDGQPLVLSYIRDISSVFRDRDRQLNAFLLYDAVIVCVSAAVVLLVSWLLTRKVRRLTAASRRIAGGEYGERAQVKSSDEIGELAAGFNTMADAVEGKITELELAGRRKDEFVAAFTHELKTPMTSIIGYADMLRSMQCDGETVFKAASYIFGEGKRLESLSLKLLDLLMLDNQATAMRRLDCGELLDYVAAGMAPAFAADGVLVSVNAAQGSIQADPDLMKTLLINLADNARKASSPGGTVELACRAEGDMLEISVNDHGRGIPGNEIDRITEAFYMVDKSRARAQHGAGLGLAIASRIAELHGTRLVIRSILGVGTSVSISLPACRQREGGQPLES